MRDCPADCPRHPRPPARDLTPKPVKIKAKGGGPYDGFELRAYDWKGPDKEIVLPEGKYVLHSETVKKHKQPKGQPREYYDETVQVYRWEQT